MSKIPKKGRFKYNLESVLKVRKIKEKREQEKYGETQRKMEEERLKAERLKDFENEKIQELRAKFEAGQQISDFGNILLRRSHLDKVKKDLQIQEKKKLESEKKNEEQRNKLVQAVKEKKVIEKDKDNKKVVWKHIMDGEEMKFIDETATNKFSRNKLGL